MCSSRAGQRKTQEAEYWSFLLELGCVRHASEIHLFGKYLMRAYYVGDNELQVQKWARQVMTLTF